MTTSVKWNGREVKNPIARLTAMTFGIVIGGALGAFTIFALVLCVAVTLPFHPILRLFGRRGFIAGDTYDVSFKAFQRARS